MFTISNILTGFNLLCGVISIIFTFSGRLEWAVLAIISGAILDFFDGFTARLLKQQGELGKQLDSLADVVTFGVAPGMIVFVLLVISGASDTIILNGGNLEDLWQEGTFGNNINYWIAVYFNDLVNNFSGLPTYFSGLNKFIPFTAFLIPFFSLFRLAKFNLDLRQATGFIGLPTPANSLFFASFALLVWHGFDSDNWESVLSRVLIKKEVLLPLIVIFSFLLVAEIPLFSLKFKTFKWKGNEVKFIFLALSVLLLTILIFWAIPLIILTYILLSLIENKILKKQ